MRCELLAVHGIIQLNFPFSNCIACVFCFWFLFVWVLCCCFWFLVVVFNVVVVSLDFFLSFFFSFFFLLFFSSFFLVMPELVIVDQKTQIVKRNTYFNATLQNTCSIFGVDPVYEAPKKICKCGAASQSVELTLRSST